LAPLTPEERRRRDRFEAVIRIAEPGLNLVLAAGERLSRLVERREDDYYPPRRGDLPPTVREAPPQRQSE
jgi:hypothetical protein